MASKDKDIVKGTILIPESCPISIRGEIISHGYDWKEVPTDALDFTHDSVGFVLNNTIFVDSAESEDIEQHFAALGYKTVRVSITSEGFRAFDYMDEGKKVGIELKKIADFDASIEDGRLFLQATKMYYSNLKYAIIIVGEHFQGNEEKMHRILGAMASLMMNYNIPVAHVKTEKDAAYLISRCLEKGANPKVISTAFLTQKKELKRQSMQLAMIASIEGIGEELAKRLLARFKTAKALFNATDKELSEVKGIGKAKIRNIRNAYENEFLDAEEKDLWNIEIKQKTEEENILTIKPITETKQTEEINWDLS